MRSQLGGKLWRHSDVSTQGSACFTSAVRNDDVNRHATGEGGRPATTLFLLPATPETNLFLVAPPVKTAAEEEDRTLSHHTATPLLTATAGTPVPGHARASGPFRRLSACRRSPPFCLQRRLNPDDGGTLRPVSRLENTRNWSCDENRRKVWVFLVAAESTLKLK